jgi:dihydroflavonol-4-reductase
LSDLALVTGATGFLGSWICRTLLAEGYRVRALHRSTSSLLAIEDLPVERMVGDILQPQSLPSTMQEVRYVFHAAAQSDYWRNPDGVLRTSIEGTRNICEVALAAGVERLVLTSSISAMGLPDGEELLNETHIYNRSVDDFPYGYAKRHAELVALEAHARGLDLVITNPSIVLGPGDINQISGSLVIEAAHGRTFLWVEGGVNYIHVKDAADGHLQALRHGSPGERYILGGQNLTYREVFTDLARIVNRRAPWLKLPHKLVPISAFLLDALNQIASMPLNGTQLRMAARYIYCDTTKAREDLNFTTQYSFHQAAQEAYTWYQDHGYI